MLLLLDWLTTFVCFCALVVLGYAFVVAPKKWLRVLVILGILIFFGFLIHGVGVLWSDYRAFR